eukprot:351805-Chlamydomonas_euryale.AAC.4
MKTTFTLPDAISLCRTLASARLKIRRVPFMRPAWESGQSNQGQAKKVVLMGPPRAMASRLARNSARPPRPQVGKRTSPRIALALPHVRTHAWTFGKRNAQR